MPNKEKLPFIDALDSHISECPCPRCQEVEKEAFEVQVKATILLVNGYLALMIIVSVLLVR